MQDHLSRKFKIRIGALCIGIAAICNEWILAALFSPDGVIEALPQKVVIWSFELMLILTGFILILYKDHISGENLILVISAMIIALIIGEIVFRVSHAAIDLWELTGRNPTPNPMSAWAVVDAFCAYRGRTGQYGNDIRKTVNSYGFISTPELTVSKPEGIIRIVFFGESSTAGTGYDLADKETWPWKVMEILRKKFDKKHFEFINAALGGYTSFESYGRLWSRIRFFSPDIAVMYHGWNEMYYFNQVDKIAQWKTLEDGSWTFDRPTLRSSPMYQPLFIDYLIRPSQLLTHLRVWMSKIRASGGELGNKPLQVLADHYDQRGLDLWRTNLRLFRETAKILGIKLFVCKQATLIVPNLPLKERERCFYEFHGFNHDAHVDAFQQIYRVIDEEISQDSIIDVTGISGHPEYFYDHIHPTVEGTDRIAEIVSNILSQYLSDVGEL